MKIFWLPFITTPILLEIVARIYTSIFMIYQVEMTRYALGFKVPHPNPQISFTHAPNNADSLMGVEIKTNSLGFRDGEFGDKDEKRRIIFLGDSITLGWGVRSDATYESLLEKNLPKTEIFNFGHGNYNTEQEANLLREKGLPLKPDDVVVFYFINDAEPTPINSRWELLGHSRFLTLSWMSVKKIKAQMNGADYKTFYSSLYSDQTEGWRRTIQAFEDLKKMSRENNFRLKVVLLPELHDLLNYPFIKEHEKIKAVLSKLEIPFLDLALITKTESPKELWVAKDDAHPNEKGHQMIANAVYNFIQGN